MFWSMFWNTLADIIPFKLFFMRSLFMLLSKFPWQYVYLYTQQIEYQTETIPIKQGEILTQKEENTKIQ